MKHQSLLLLMLMGAILLWPGCDDDDGVTPTCQLSTPTVDYGTNCDDNLLILNKLDAPQPGTLPAIPLECGMNPETRRIIRVDASEDGTLFLQFLTSLPATITFKAYGGDCNEDFFALTDCISFDAVGSVREVIDGMDFPDVYVVIDFSIFDDDQYVNYELDGDDYIAVGAIEELPQLGSIAYGENEGGANRLPISCDGSAAQRIVICSCDRDADLAGWAEEIGFPISEFYQGDGAACLALDVPRGLDPNGVGERPGGATPPSTPPRRPIADSSNMYVSPDYLIEIPSVSNGQLFPFDQGEKPSPVGTEPCLAFEPKQGKGNGTVRVTMIDSGVELGGAWDQTWDDFRARKGGEDQFFSNGGLGYDFITDDRDPDDKLGHGTATGGTLIGGYRGEDRLEVVHYKIFGDEGFSVFYGAVVALNSAIDINSDIINMSWGFEGEETPRALECALQRAKDKGVAVVVSAGNLNAPLDFQPQWPAAFSDPSFGFDNLLSVGSMEYPSSDIEDDPIKSDFSSFSSKRVDVSAYLTSASPEFGAASADDVVFIAGTSFSAPIVARSLATALGNNGSYGDWRGGSFRFSSPLFSNGHVENGSYLPLCVDF